MSQLNRARRRTLICNRPLQSRIILTMSWPAAVGLVVCASLLGIFCYRLTDEALKARVELPSVVPVFLTVIVFLVVAGMYVFFNAVKFSNRVAGPMYRLGKTLQAVQEGDLSVRSKLRDGDLLSELADGMNAFLDWLEEHPPQGVEVQKPAEEAEVSVDEVPGALVAAGEPAAELVETAENGTEKP